MLSRLPPSAGPEEEARRAECSRAIQLTALLTGNLPRSALGGLHHEPGPNALQQHGVQAREQCVRGLVHEQSAQVPAGGEGAQDEGRAVPDVQPLQCRAA